MAVSLHFEMESHTPGISFLRSSRREAGSNLSTSWTPCWNLAQPCSLTSSEKREVVTMADGGQGC